MILILVHFLFVYYLLHVGYWSGDFPSLLITVFFVCFYTPVTRVRGHYGLPLSVRPYVCLSISHTLRYRVCVINSSYSCQWIFLKPCILIVDIMKMCMWIFDGARINYGLSNLVILRNFWHSRV